MYLEECRPHTKPHTRSMNKGSKAGYRKDKLTLSPSKSPNWLISFRIPTELTDHPLFKGRSLNTAFQKSTGTSNYFEACKVRDAFFETHDIFQAKETPLTAEQSYALTFSGQQQLSPKMLGEVIGELTENSLDRYTPRATQHYHALLLGHLNREKIEENPLVELSHPYAMTLERCLTLYCNYRSDLPAKTLNKAKNAVRRFLEFSGSSHILLDKIIRPAVSRYCEQFITTTNLSRKTLENDLSFLGSIYAYAQDHGYLNENLKNPFQKIKLPPNRAGKPNSQKAISIIHAKGFYRACKDRNVKIAIAISHYCGTRISETFSGKLGRNEAGHPYLDVAENGSGKTASASRKIPLSDGLVAQLLTLNVAIPKEGLTPIPWDIQSLSGFEKRIQRAKAEYIDSLKEPANCHISMHAFRHAFATYLANDYGELLATTLTGHKSNQKAISELGRTYYHGSTWDMCIEMVEAIPDL